MDSLPMAGWLSRTAHRQWLAAEGQGLLAFYRASRHAAGGFAALDEHGRLPADAQPDTMLTARMTHCYALAAMQGIPGALWLAQHGVDSLNGVLKDHQYGGWYKGLPQHDTSSGNKEAYLHAFVGVAAGSAMLAGVDGAHRLLTDAADILKTRFWSEQEGRFTENYSRDWRTPEAYRGANSNMHATEACLALADALNAPEWRQRALSICTHLVHGVAREHDYLIVEHFDADWQPILDYNAEHPGDPFRPPGATPGHALEWARLLLQLEAALVAAAEPAPAWLLTDAIALFDKALAVGWQAGGTPGLVYTVDWQGKPLVALRLHWTLAEAVATAAALFQRTREVRFEQWYRHIWDVIDTFMIDHQHGSWWHELSATNAPSRQIWPGKPDLYHAYQATLLPRLPLAPGMARAIANNQLA